MVDIATNSYFFSIALLHCGEVIICVDSTLGGQADNCADKKFEVALVSEPCNEVTEIRALVLYVDTFLGSVRPESDLAYLFDPDQ